MEEGKSQMNFPGSFEYLLIQTKIFKGLTVHWACCKCWGDSGENPALMELCFIREFDNKPEK